MKKKIVMGLMTVGMSAMLLAGCGNSESAEATEATEAVEEVAEEVTEDAEEVVEETAEDTVVIEDAEVAGAAEAAYEATTESVA